MLVKEPAVLQFNLVRKNLLAKISFISFWNLVEIVYFEYKCKFNKSLYNRNPPKDL